MKLGDLVRKQMSGQGRHFGIVEGVRSGEGQWTDGIGSWRVDRSVGGRIGYSGLASSPHCRFAHPTTSYSGETKVPSKLKMLNKTN